MRVKSLRPGRICGRGRRGIGASLVWAAVRFLPVIGMLSAGCAHRRAAEITAFMYSDEAYLALPQGPERVDAVYAHAKRITGSDKEAIALLGSLAVHEGIQFRHPYNTGLTTTGVLASSDKAGHFFAHAMWQYQDEDRLVPWAETRGLMWEVVGEIKSWVSSGNGFDWDDIWANRIGREFGRRVYAGRGRSDAGLVPSAVIVEARGFRPTRATSDAAGAELSMANREARR